MEAIMAYFTDLFTDFSFGKLLKFLVGAAALDIFREIVC